MKKFETIQAWLDSDPSPETTGIILNSINRSSESEYKKSLIRKGMELRKIEKAITTMEEANLPVPDTLRDTEKELLEQISSLKRRLL